MNKKIIWLIVVVVIIGLIFVVRFNQKPSDQGVIKGAWSFGFNDVDKNFSAQLSHITSGQKLSTEYGAAIAYWIHGV